MKFCLNLNISRESEISQDELVTWLESAGYTRLAQLENSKEFSVRGEVIDVWLPEGDGVRITFDYDHIDRIRVFTGESDSEIPEFTFPLAEASALMAKWKGNISYYYGPPRKGMVFCILRGKGFKMKEAAAFVRARGFKYQRRSSFRRVFGYAHTMRLEDFREMLKWLDRMGYNIVPSGTLDSSKHFDI